MEKLRPNLPKSACRKCLLAASVKCESLSVLANFRYSSSNESVLEPVEAPTATATDLQPPSLLVQLVDGPPPLAQLVQQILDLLGQVLVLPPHGVQLLDSLVPGCAEPE